MFDGGKNASKRALDTQIRWARLVGLAALSHRRIRAARSSRRPSRRPQRAKRWNPSSSPRGAARNPCRTRRSRSLRSPPRRSSASRPPARWISTRSRRTSSSTATARSPATTPPRRSSFAASARPTRRRPSIPAWASTSTTCTWAARSAAPWISRHRQRADPARTAGNAVRPQHHRRCRAAHHQCAGRRRGQLGARRRWAGQPARALSAPSICRWVTMVGAARARRSRTRWLRDAGVRRRGSRQRGDVHRPDRHPLETVGCLHAHPAWRLHQGGRERFALCVPRHE